MIIRRFAAAFVVLALAASPVATAGTVVFSLGPPAGGSGSYGGPGTALAGSATGPGSAAWDSGGALAWSAPIPDAAIDFSTGPNDGVDSDTVTTFLAGGSVQVSGSLAPGGPPVVLFRGAVDVDSGLWHQGGDDYAYDGLGHGRYSAAFLDAARALDPSGGGFLDRDYQFVLILDFQPGVIAGGFDAPPTYAAVSAAADHVAPEPAGATLMGLGLGLCWLAWLLARGRRGLAWPS